MTLRFALAGNPNSGKTTLFNQLTGSRAHVGNWPGVTVERREGQYVKNPEGITIVDLPGIYSLSPYSQEEVVARDYIIRERPDLIINIIDATNFERNLYLTTQLMELDVPVIIALNMMDEVEHLGDKIDIDKIEKELNIPIVGITASKGAGLDELIKKAIHTVNLPSKEAHTILNDTSLYPVIKKIKDVYEAANMHIPMFSVIKLIEGDKISKRNFNLDDKNAKLVEKIVSESEKNLGSEWEIVIAELRYKFITEISNKYIKKARKSGELTLSDKIDRFVTNKFLAFPIFFIVLYIMFSITFGRVGSFLTDSMDYFVNYVIASTADNLLVNLGASDWAVSLIVDGMIPGVFMVLIFMPQILLLFFFLSLLEDTGYMSRAAFITDKLLRNFGLSGKSFVPMLMGFGCSVPAIMAARTLENEKDRKITIILTPFMSCGARLPVYAVFTGALFADRNIEIIIISLYLLGVAVALISGLILKSTFLRGDEPPFIMELPPYRMPLAKNVLIHMWEKAKDFIVRALTILLCASIIVWFLQSFNFSLQMVEDNSNSIFGTIGKVIAPLFTPLGFGNWRASVSLLTGFVAKEAVVSTLGILYNAGDVTELNEPLAAAISSSFTGLQAYSYMAFVLLYMPCVVAFATIKKELNSWKWTAFAVCYQTSAAWIVSFIVYQGGMLLGL